MLAPGVLVAGGVVLLPLAPLGLHAQQQGAGAAGLAHRAVGLGVQPHGGLPVFSRIRRMQSIAWALAAT